MVVNDEMTKNLQEQKFLSGLRVLFVNQTDIFSNGSAGVTIRSLFEDKICDEALVIQIVNDRRMIISFKHQIIFDVNNYYFSLYKIMKIINKYMPDIIYTTGSSIRTLLFILLIKRVCHLPVLIHYYDNWRETGKKYMKNFLLKHIEDNHVGALVISEEMKKAYHDKYGNKYSVFMALCECACSSKKVSESSFLDGKKHFIYAGGLHLSRHKMLLEAQSAIKSMEDTKCILDIYTFQRDRLNYEHLFDSQYTVFHDSVPHDYLSKIYYDADALLYVESVDNENYDYIKYSMSTKIPEYLSSEKAILCLSKPGIASYNYFKRNNAALIAENVTEIYKAFTQICNGDPQVSVCVNNAKKAFEIDFQVEINRKELLMIILDAVKNNRRRIHTT